MLLISDCFAGNKCNGQNTCESKLSHKIRFVICPMPLFDYYCPVQQVAHYFPELTTRQQAQLAALPALYTTWNERINVISRKDIANITERHILHSLAIAKFLSLKPGAKVMDMGTGGGFPGVPLAIVFPDVRFHLVDSIGKKLKVIEAVKAELELQNIFTFHNRAEEMNYRYDFVVSRAVAPLPVLLQWTRGKYLPGHQHSIRNGLICLKGGDLSAETAGIKNLQLVPLKQFFTEDYFAEKYLVYRPE